MQNISARLAQIDWAAVTENMNDSGYARVPGLLTDQQCNQLIDQYDSPGLYRKTITMERYRFGQGEYKYFSYPLPDPIQTIRENTYPHLAPIANGWMKALAIDTSFPDSFEALQSLCHAGQQDKPTVLILKYGKGGHNTLHQDLYGDIFFPIQLVLFLDQPGVDYTGGEFVLVQQTPRAQSRAIVLQPRKGDMLIFTTNFRPVKSASAGTSGRSRGYYRVNMKHGVSELWSGHRHTLGIIFHDAH